MIITFEYFYYLDFYFTFIDAVRIDTGRAAVVGGHLIDQTIFILILWWYRIVSRNDFGYEKRCCKRLITAAVFCIVSWGSRCRKASCQKPMQIRIIYNCIVHVIV